MKLSLLNASHTLLSYPSFLSGYRKVDEAMQDRRIVRFVEDFMDIDVTPYVPAPKSTDLNQYKKRLIERFSNIAVSDQIARLCGDGGSKFQVYIIPIIKKMMVNGDNMVRIAYLIAAYRHYLKYKIDDKAVSFDIFEPQLTADDISKFMSDNPLAIFSTTTFSAVDIIPDTEFYDLYLSFVSQIETCGAMTTLETIIKNRSL